MVLMTIHDTDTIDYLGIEKSSGRITMAIYDDMEWTDAVWEEHWVALQGKVNRYLDCIETGEVFLEVSQRTGREISKTTPIVIRVMAKYAPSEDDGNWPRLREVVHQFNASLTVDYTPDD
jgi:hypothetical protein